MRLRETTIGTLNLLNERSGPYPAADVVVAKAFADVATIGILQDRALRESDVVRHQLQHALNSRVVIEQAKGVVAQTRKVSVDVAFTIIRDYARSHSMKLVDVAARPGEPHPRSLRSPAPISRLHSCLPDVHFQCRPGPW